jgi:hypothetical protein
MYESKKTPGKKFGSSFAGKNYDEKHSSDGMHKMGGEEETKEPLEQDEHETPAEDNAESRTDEQGEGTNPDANEQGEADMHPVVQEHGAAHTVHIKHHEGGKSHVMSHHPDGHTNMSEHEDPREAHDEARKLAGHPADGQAKDHDSPYHQGKDQASASSENDSFEMPDLV